MCALKAICAGLLGQTQFSMTVGGALLRRRFGSARHSTLTPGVKAVPGFSRVNAQRHAVNAPRLAKQVRPKRDFNA